MAVAAELLQHLVDTRDHARRMARIVKTPGEQMMWRQYAKTVDDHLSELQRPPRDTRATEDSYRTR